MKKVNPEAYGMDCRPGPSRYPAANMAALKAEMQKPAKAAPAAKAA